MHISLAEVHLVAFQEFTCTGYKLRLAYNRKREAKDF